MRELPLVRRALGEPAALDTAVSAAILDEVSAGETPASLRLHRLPDVEVTPVADGHPDGDEEMVQVWSVPPGESDPPSALGAASTTIAAALETLSDISRTFSECPGR
jgi:hypothetical protein